MMTLPLLLSVGETGYAATAVGSFETRLTDVIADHELALGLRSLEIISIAEVEDYPCCRSWCRRYARWGRESKHF